MAMNNSLAEVRPELVPEWSEKNLPLKPDTVYWSSDNINANKFADGQKLTMTYALKEKEKESEISKTEDPEQETDTTETTESETEILCLKCVSEKYDSSFFNQ